MTTERTLRITDEMAVRLAKILFDSDKVFWVSRARDALKAVLEPHLERRNGERRAGVNGSAPHSAQEQNKAPDTHVSEGMIEAGYVGWQKRNTNLVIRCNGNAEWMSDVYRAMEAQRRKDWGCDGLGPGGA